MSYSFNEQGDTYTSSNNDAWWLVVVILLVLVVAAAGAALVASGNVTLFEDGSAMFGRFNLGCVVWFWGCA